ncbi:hypothetical protein BESB_062560 [Besnoitia besnoiti]|uniref:Uncharacterized protein n=1 Tax=Besnoitia besnoiti TaxID=94643 RepID=A0A2A9MBX5_BESBE|nr:hypothetical protein BESB_062560 [Besnoitia besnoiti]PFH35369.1 hypothetical protein BESB_062560 [Besnoitia besnoiti]
MFRLPNPVPRSPSNELHANDALARCLQLLTATSLHGITNHLEDTRSFDFTLPRSSADEQRKVPFAQQTLRCGPNNTLFIFDWDDTLFPSTWLRCAGVDPLNPLQLRTLDDLPRHVQDALTVCEEMVLQVLEAAHSLGMVMVVSNAHTRWLRLSLDKLMPRVGALMRQREVAVMSARCVCEAVGCADAVLWKTATFDAILDAFMRGRSSRSSRPCPRGPSSGGVLRLEEISASPQHYRLFPSWGDPRYERIPHVLQNSPTAAVASMALEDRDAIVGPATPGEGSVRTSNGVGRGGSVCGASSSLHRDVAGGAHQGRVDSADGGVLQASRLSKALQTRGDRRTNGSTGPKSGVRFSPSLSIARQRSSSSYCSSCSGENSGSDEEGCGRICAQGECSGWNGEDDTFLDSTPMQADSFYNILAVGDQAHDRFAFFTAAQNVLQRRKAEACQHLQADQHTPEQEPRFLELDTFTASSYATVPPVVVASSTGTSCLGQDLAVEPPSLLDTQFEVVIDFDNAGLQRQVRQLQALQQKHFPLPLCQQLQPLASFAQQTSAVSERLQWHFRWPTSPLLSHAPETLLLRRLSHTSSDSRSATDDRDGGGADELPARGELPFPENSTQAGQWNSAGDAAEAKATPRSGARRARKRQVRRPGPRSHGGVTRPSADLRLRKAAADAMQGADCERKVLERGQQTDEQKGGRAGGDFPPQTRASTGVGDGSQPVYAKSIRLMAGPSAAELSQQLGVLLSSLRRLAESPSFHDLQMQNEGIPPPHSASSTPSRSKTPTERGNAASVASAASAAAMAAAVAAASAAATAAAAAQGAATPRGAFSAPVEAVFAASAAARAAATAAATAADAFAATAAERCVEAAVNTGLIPLPPEANEQTRKRQELGDLAQRTHLAKYFNEWRRLVAHGNKATELKNGNHPDTVPNAPREEQGEGGQAQRLTSHRPNELDDSSHGGCDIAHSEGNFEEDMDAFGAAEEEKLMRVKCFHRGSPKRRMTTRR